MRGRDPRCGGIHESTRRWRRPKIFRKNSEESIRQSHLCRRVYDWDELFEMLGDERVIKRPVLGLHALKEQILGQGCFAGLKLLIRSLTLFFKRERMMLAVFFGESESKDCAEKRLGCRLVLPQLCRLQKPNVVCKVFDGLCRSKTRKFNVTHSAGSLVQASSQLFSTSFLSFRLHGIMALGSGYQISSNRRCTKLKNTLGIR